MSRCLYLLDGFSNSEHWIEPCKRIMLSQIKSFFFCFESLFIFGWIVAYEFYVQYLWFNDFDLITWGDFKKASSEWFISYANGFSTLVTSHCLILSHFVSLGRKCNMSILSAITALSLVQGMSASPFDPILLHFFVHNCDLHSIYPGILGKWHPILKQTVTDWINMGPGGDATLF